MDTPAQPRPFRIDLTDGEPVVEVDGVNVAAQIAGATVHLGYGEPTRLIIEKPGPGSLQGVGLVEVAGGPSPAEAVACLDPEEVEELAMSIDEGPRTMAENYLDAIVQILVRP